MDITKLKVTTEIMSKTDGKKYVVIEKDSDTALAQLIEKEEPRVLGSSTVRITKDNMVCFCANIPQYYVEGGKIFNKNGKKITSESELYINKILYDSWPGILLLSIKNSDDNVRIFSYHIERDSFHELAVIPEPHVVKLETSGGIALYYNHVIANDKDNFLCDSGVLILENGNIRRHKRGIKYFLKCPMICDNTLFFNVNKTLTENYVPELTDTSDKVLVINEEDFCTIDMKGLKRVKKSHIYKGFLLYNGDKLLHTDLKTEYHIPLPVGLDEKYCFLVEYSEDYNGVRITLASEDFQTVSFVVNQGKVVTN